MENEAKIKDFLYAGLTDKQKEQLEEYFIKLPLCKTPIEERDIPYAKIELLVRAL